MWTAENGSVGAGTGERQSKGGQAKRWRQKHADRRTEGKIKWDRSDSLKRPYVTTQHPSCSNQTMPGRILCLTILLASARLLCAGDEALASLKVGEPKGIVRFEG